MADRKPRDQWSPAYRRRVEREEARARAEGRAPNKTRARGKGSSPAEEYAKRKASEKARAGPFHPMTPAQVRHYRSFKATDSELRDIAKLPQATIKKLMADQRAHMNNPKYRAEWTIEEMLEAWPGTEPIMFWYHSALGR